MNRIYYFSATGNSLVVAREIAAHLDECDIVHIADAMDRSEAEGTFERIGFVHPTYGWGPPRMFHEFIDSSRIPDAGYYFAVATHGGTVASGLKVLSRQLASHGVTLHAGFAVKEGHYQPDPDHNKHPAVRFVRAVNGYPETRARSFAERRDEILSAVQQKQSAPAEFDRALGSAVAARFHPVSLKGFAKAHNTFVQTDDCIGCGICARICPRSNITLDNGRLTWGGNCEGCFACVQWCRRRAILIKGLDRMTLDHNPACKVKDLIRNG